MASSHDADEAAALLEACDLSREEKLEILAATRHIDSQNHWQILGLHGAPTSSEIKRAYFSRSKSFHPDRFFGKNLGSFRTRVDRLFQAVRRAYDVLSDDAQRAAYAQRVPPPTATGASATPVSDTSTRRLSDAELEARRQAIIEERKAKRHMPAGGGTARATELVASALKQMGVGEHVQAAASLRTAASLDPANTEARRLLEEADRGSAPIRAARLAQQAEAKAKEGDATQAAQGYAQAFEIAPAKLQYGLRAAEEFLKSGEYKRGLAIAKKLVELAPKRQEARLIAAQLYEANGEIPNAIEELKSLDGKDPHVMKQLNRLAKLDPT